MDSSGFDISFEKMIKEIWKLPDSFQCKDSLKPGDIKQWDSLGMLQLMDALETWYKIDLEFEDMILINSLGDVKKIVRNKIEE